MTQVFLWKVAGNSHEARDQLIKKFEIFMLEQYREPFMTDDFVRKFVSERVVVNFVEVTPENFPALVGATTLNSSARPTNCLCPYFVIDISPLINEPYFNQVKSFFERFSQLQKNNMDVFQITKFLEDMNRWVLAANWLNFL